MAKEQSLLSQMCEASYDLYNEEGAWKAARAADRAAERQCMKAALLILITQEPTAAGLEAAVRKALGQ